MLGHAINEDRSLRLARTDHPCAGNPKVATLWQHADRRQTLLRQQPLKLHGYQPAPVLAMTRTAVHIEVGPGRMHGWLRLYPALPAPTATTSAAATTLNPTQFLKATPRVIRYLPGRKTEDATRVCIVAHQALRTADQPPWLPPIRLPRGKAEPRPVRRHQYRVRMIFVPGVAPGPPQTLETLQELSFHGLPIMRPASDSVR